ncbi:MAG: ABC transporter permease [Burkholderiaceae bacterium]|jgi:ABC-2 type transport system permease protein|nr:ABC transporter permease [Burkholderiaceae bacterium]
MNLWLAWRRFLAVVVKESRQWRRDRMSIGMLFGIPILMLVLFGYAINLNLRHLPTGIADLAGTSASRATVMDMVATNIITPKLVAASPQQLIDALRRGRISIGVVIEPDFEARLAEGREAVQVLVDGSDTVVQSAAMQLAQMPVMGSDAAQTAQTERTPTALTPGNGPIRVVSFYNPERRSAVNIVPGLIGAILTMTMVLFTAVAIVRERERGNLELLIATPLSSVELMVGKIAPCVVFGLVQTTLILVVGAVIFRVPMAGSLVSVYGAAGLLVIANLSLGMMISNVVKSQFQAMQLTMMVFLPSILLSGFMFPFDGMPRPAQWIAECLPLTHALRLIRGVMLRGAGLLELWPDILALLAFTAVMMTVAILKFHKRLD